MTEELKKDMLHTIDTKVRYDNLFWWFESNLFKNEGNYPRRTNLIFEFAEWIDNLDDDALAEHLDLFADYKDIDDVLKAARQARKEILSGIDIWLGE